MEIESLEEYFKQIIATQHDVCAIRIECHHDHLQVYLIMRGGETMEQLEFLEGTETDSWFSRVVEFVNRSQLEPGDYSFERKES